MKMLKQHGKEPKQPIKNFKNLRKTLITLGKGLRKNMGNLGKTPRCL